MLKGEAGDGSSAAGREGFNFGKMIKGRPIFTIH